MLVLFLKKRNMRLLCLLSFLVLFACTKKSSPSGSTVVLSNEVVDKNWTFDTVPVWTDEFNTAGAPDPSKWGYDTGGSGWGNNELQFYTTSISNASVSNGKLVITARKENSGGRNYTSARLVSRTKGDFLYGRIEVLAKIPGGRGTWPAIWMLPTDWEYGGWPKSGEIDIMEHVGYDSTRVHFSVHTEAYNHSINTQKSTNRIIPTAITEFHKYRVDWTPYAVRGYYDDNLMFTFVNEGTGSAKWPFDKRFHLLLNIAVGGDWGGLQGVNDAAFPAAMEIDYVRVFKMKE
jgi:beta-glucanase (GH16 family)